LAERSDTVLQSLCQNVLALSRAGSAGVSLKSISDAGAPIFVWPAIAGGWSSYVGGTMPRDASPCGMVINAQIPLLFPRTHEFFAPFETIEPPIVEVLLAPFFSEGMAVGTVWAICHDPDRRFEREDARVLQSISHFAAAAYRTIQTNEAGQKTQERLNLTLSNAEIVGLRDWHIPEDRVFADERIARLFGVDPARAAAGAPIVEFLGGIDVEDRERVREQIAVALQTGAPYSSEYRVNAEPGAVRYVIARGKCEFAPNGAPLRFPGAIVDVTELRRAELALHASEDQFHRLAQAMPNHVWTAAADGRLDWLNHQAYAFSGAEAGSLVGRKWLAFVHPDDLASVLATWEQALRTGEPYQMEFRLRRADGVYRWHLARAVPLDWKTGRGGRWIGTNTDIEDQKATLRALADVNALLEERVAQRTQELRAAEQSIRQLQKIEAVGKLTGGIAHDFNNILTGITGSLELIQRRLDTGHSDGIDRYMTLALSAAQRAAGLTQRLLAFARQQSLDIKRQDINALITSMEDMLHRTLGESIRLQTRKQSDLWPALTDANQFENALLNLVINARDAMPDGGSLTVETTNIQLDARMAAAGNMAPGEYIVVAVSDTGEGMPPDVIEKAFDPFFTTKPVGAGTGLGLSMIYGFAQQSGGNVRIYSEVGNGTTVRLFLRRDTGEAIVESEAPPTPILAGRGETVLVVEDDPAVRLLVGEVLDELGYRKFEAANAMEALPVLHSARSIDLMVTDVGLPHINGRQLAEIARARRPDLKVLFVTGYAAHASVRRGVLEAGMDVMTKPFALDALATKIREMLCN
jgi:PAS domain S-box-containing protein